MVGRSVLHWVCVFALVALPVGGCSDETAAAGGSGGDGGSGGTGGVGVSCEGTVCPCNEAGINAAIAAGGDDPHTFACDGPTTVVTEGIFIIDNDVILDGEGNLTVDGNDASPVVFLVNPGVTAELRGLTVSGGVGICGRDCTWGGGIENNGTLTLTNSTVSENSSEEGGVHNTGTMTVTNSLISDNEGGGIVNEGRLTLTNSTVSGNLENGIFADGGMVTLTNSTVSGNAGVDIAAEGDVSLTLTNSLVAGVCAGAVTSNGYNIESPGDTCGFDQEGDQAGSAVELDLQPLADNGGPTQTHAITTDSAAFNAGTCEVDEDQRGVTRPQGTMCDVGAFELEQ